MAHRYFHLASGLASGEALYQPVDDRAAGCRDLTKIKDVDVWWSYPLTSMNPSRRQRLRKRLSILAIFTLLWAQFAMASHPFAAMVGTGNAAATATAATNAPHQGCVEGQLAEHDAVCSTHCKHGDQANEIGKIPPVPFLDNVSRIFLPLLVEAIPGSCSLSDAAPLAAWHRPTRHPASLLLI